ncbi:MAG: YcjF family protein [Alphaproteobacteria bacterium]
MNAEVKKDVGPKISSEELSGLSQLEQANKITKTFMLWSAGGGLIPFPGWDIAAIYAAQITMLSKMTKVYNIPFSENKVKNVLLPLFASVGIMPAATGIFASVLKFIPIVGQLVGVVSLPVIAGALTYATGKVFAAHFEAGGNLLDLKPEEVKTHFKKMFEEGKELSKQTSK